MTRQILMTLSGIGCAFLLLDSEVLAQAGDSETESLESIVEQLPKLDELTRQKAETFLLAVDAEAAAKRISDPVAEELRWTARKFINPVGGDRKTLLSSARLPSENKVIMDAATELGDEASKAQAKRDTLMLHSSGEVRKRTRNAILTARNPGDVAPLLSVLQGLTDDVKAHSDFGVMDPRIGALSDCADLLRTLSTTFDASIRRDPEAVEGGIAQIKALTASHGDIASFDEAVRQIRSIEAPFVAKFEKAQESLETALINGKPAAEVFAALNKMEDALGAGVPPGIGRKLSTYRMLATFGGAPKSMESGDREEKLAQAQDSISSSSFEEAREAKLRKLLAEWRGTLTSNSVDSSPDTPAALVAKLKEAKQPSDLEALAVGIQRTNAVRNQGNKQATAYGAAAAVGISESLATLAAAWKMGDLNLLAPAQRGEPLPDTGEFAESIAQLRERIERELLSKTLGAPELLHPPLAGEPLLDAMNTYCDQLAEKGDWQRLLKVLETRNPPHPDEEVRTPESETIASLRSFFAGKNLERAGQWSEAAANYKTVLRIAAERGPVEDAAIAVKAIKKEHPEAFNAVPPAVRIPTPR